ncbi:hypothetical protein ACFE04_014861 [Oxalis oulophora]
MELKNETPTTSSGDVADLLPLAVEVVDLIENMDLTMTVTTNRDGSPLVDEKNVPMLEEEDSVTPATVFCIRLRQALSNLQHKMSCRCVVWETQCYCLCIRNLCKNFKDCMYLFLLCRFAHLTNPERPTECAVFNVIADSPRHSVQFIEWSPTSSRRALLIANFHGRGPANLVRDASCWKCEHEWQRLTYLQTFAFVEPTLANASFPFERRIASGIHIATWF